MFWGAGVGGQKVQNVKLTTYACPVYLEHSNPQQKMLKKDRKFASATETKDTLLSYRSPSVGQIQPTPHHNGKSTC